MTVMTRRKERRSAEEWVFLAVLCGLLPLGVGLLTVPRLAALAFKDEVYALKGNVTLELQNGTLLRGVLTGPSVACGGLTDSDIRSRYNVLLPSGTSIPGIEIRDVKVNTAAPAWLLFLGSYYQQDNSLTLDGEQRNCVLKLRWK